MSKFPIFGSGVFTTNSKSSNRALTLKDIRAFIELLENNNNMAPYKDNPAKPPYNAKMTITYLPEVDAYKINFSYWSTGVMFLKSTVPASDRMYDPNTKEWTVSQVYFDNIKMFFEGVGYTIKGFTKEDYEKFQKSQYEAQQQSQGIRSRLVSVEDEFNKFIRLLEDVERKDLKVEDFKHYDKSGLMKFYRKMAFAFHPDKNNGDAKRMTELNVTWDNLKKYHFKES